MRYRFGALLGAAALAMIAGTAGSAAASPVTAHAVIGAPVPAPTLTCPPALPISGWVSAATPTTLTISYSMLLTPPCGYDPPVAVALFGSLADAQQWQNPVAEAVSGPERSGTVTIEGLTPDTGYWFRFSAQGHPDPYVIVATRTTAIPVCTATMAIGTSWGGGFTATVTVRNAGDDTLNGWHVSWRWPGDEQIVTVWNGVRQSSGADVAVGNTSYNGKLVRGGSTTFGMVVAPGTPPADLALTCDR